MEERSYKDAESLAARPVLPKVRGGWFRLTPGWTWAFHVRSATAWAVSLALWMGAMFATPLVVWLVGENVFPLMATLGVLAHVTTTLAAQTGGWPARRMAATLGVILVGTWAVEAIGLATGFPFGHYEYTDALQPQLGGVPLLIPLAWTMMLIPAWAVAEAILIRQRDRLGQWYFGVLAVLAGLVFAAWDLYLDPQMVAHGLWVWDSPKGYFGIPWVNFAGWWLSAAVITLVVRPTNLQRPRLMAIYSVTWLMQAIALGVFWGQPGPALVGFVGMGAFAIWGWADELRQ